MLLVLVYYVAFQRSLPRHYRDVLVSQDGTEVLECFLSLGYSDLDFTE